MNLFSRHCERSEAIQQERHGRGICAADAASLDCRVAIAPRNDIYAKPGTC